MKFSRWIFLWIMPMVAVSLGSVPLDTTHPLLEIARRYRRWVGENRGRRSAPEAPVCKAEDLEADPNKFCLMCPPGYHSKKETECEKGCQCLRCPDGSYTEKNNSLRECRACYSCDEESSVIQLTPCRHDRQTRCGCKEGYYVSDSSQQNFACRKCKCTDRSKHEACSVIKDTQCGPCRSNFYEDDKQTCQPCTQNDFKKPGCQHHSTMTSQFPSTTKPPVLDSHILVFTVCMVVLLVLIILLCCFLNVCTCFEWAIRRWNQAEASKRSHHFNLVRDVPQGKGNPTLSATDLYCETHKEPLTLVVRPSLRTPKMCQTQDTTTEMLVNTGMCSSATSLLKDTDPKMLRVDPPGAAGRWPAPVLYAIIHEVPARRWKEFLRQLSVPDGQMERVEMEAGPCYLEQQYQMLRLWSRQGGVTLGAVYDALHGMNLAGCAQELQDKLQQLQQQAA